MEATDRYEPPMDVIVPVREAQRWFALALLFFAQMVAIGSISYGFSVLLKPLVASYGVTRAQANYGLMAVMIGMAVFSPLIGRALDRVSGRLIVMSGAALFVAGWLMIAATQNAVVALLAAFFLLAPGAAAMGPLAASTLVSRWFTEKRGLALGIVSVASSTGGVVVVPLIAQLIEAFGWRQAMAAFALVASAIVLLMALVVMPGGSDRPAEQTAASVGEQPGNLFLIRDFWLIAGAVGSLMAINGALLSCLVSYATDRGFTMTQGAALMSVISGTAVLGKLGIGALSDRVDPRWLFLGVIVLNACLLTMLISNPSYDVLFAVATLTGPAVGGVLPLWAMLVSGRFGVVSMGRVMGLMSLPFLPLNLLGLHIVSTAFATTRSYIPAFEIYLAVLIFVAIAILPVKAGKRQ